MTGGPPDPRPPGSRSASSPTSCRARVLIGFLTGVGIQVAMGQVGGMLGHSRSPVTVGHAIEKFVGDAGNIGETSLTTVARVGRRCIVTIVGLKAIDAEDPRRADRRRRLDLRQLEAGDLAAHGVATLGPVPSGLPALRLPRRELERVRRRCWAPPCRSSS